MKKKAALTAEQAQGISARLRAGPYTPTLTDVAILRLTPWLPCLAGERERNVLQRAYKTIGVDMDLRLTVEEAEREIRELLSGVWASRAVEMAK